MFGFPFAKYLFAYSKTIGSIAANDDIVFNNFGLQNGTIITSKFNPEDTAQVEYNAYPIPKDDGTGLYSRYWRQKTITLHGIIKGASQIDMEIAMDSMKGKLNKQKGEFKYKSQGIYRVILATCTSVVFNREHFHINFCPFTITLQTNEPFFHDETLTTITNTGVTGATLVDEVVNIGYVNSKPKIYFVVNSETSLTTVSVTMNSRTLTYTGTLNAADIVIMDCQEKTVTLNGVLVDYSGTFPELIPGSNSVTYAADATHNLDISISFRKNYL